MIIGLVVGLVVAISLGHIAANIVLLKKLGWPVANFLGTLVPIFGIIAQWSLAKGALIRAERPPILVWLVLIPIAHTILLGWLVYDIWPEEEEFGRWWTR